MQYCVYAKASLTHEQIGAKLKAGCDGLEIQLLGEMLGSNGDHDWKPNVFDNKVSEFLDYPVDVVHAPLIPGHGDTTIERLVDAVDYPLIDAVFKLANEFGKYRFRKTIVVFHTEMYMEIMKDLGSLWNRLVITLDNILTTYPYVQLAIENVSPLRGVGKGKELHLANNFAFDNVEMAVALREELKTKDIGTCLDTCHAFLTEKYIGGLYKMIADRPMPNYTLKHFYEENKDVLFLMHVSDMFGSGYGKGRHGIPFTSKTYGELSDILRLHDRIVPSVPITLEVEENDFLHPTGFIETYNLVKNFYNM